MVYDEIMKHFVNILFYCTCVLYGLGQLGRVHIPDQPIYFYLYELFIVFITLILIFTYKQRPLKHYDFTHPIILFLVWMGISIFISFFYYSWIENFIAFLYAVRLFIYGVFTVYFYYFIHIEKIKLSRLIFILSIWILLSSVIQYFLYPNIGNIAYLGWDPHVSRLVGIFLDPPIAASIFFLAGWYMVSRFFFQKYWIQAVILSIISCIFIVLTYSRGAIVALFSTVIIYSVSVKRYGIIVFSIIVISTLIYFIPKAQTESINLMRTTSITARFDDYQKGLEILRKNPFFGIGYNHIRFEKEVYIDEVFLEDYNPSHGIASFHSSFMTILVTGGIVGFVLFLYAIYSISRKNQLLFISIIFLSIISLFDNVLLHPFVIFFLGLLYVENA